MPPPPRRGRVSRRFAENVMRQSTSHQNEGRSFINPWEEGHEPFGRRPPHYEDDPYWKGREREDGGYQRQGYHHDTAIPNPRGSWGRGRRDKLERGGEKKVAQAEPPLVLRGIPHLEHSFIMNKHTTEGGPHPDDRARGKPDEGVNRDGERRWEERHIREDERHMRDDKRLRQEERHIRGEKERCWEEAQRNSDRRRWEEMQRHEGGQKVEEMHRDEERRRWEEERRRQEQHHKNEERHWQERHHAEGANAEHRKEVEVRRWPNQQVDTVNRPPFHHQASGAPTQCPSSSQTNSFVHTPSDVDQFVSSFRHPPPHVTSQPPPDINQCSNQTASLINHGGYNPNHSQPPSHHSQPPSYAQLHVSHPSNHSQPHNNHQTDNKQASGSKQASFTPTQVMELAAPSILEKETERYYDELQGKEAQAKKPLSASQVAKITKEYKTSEETKKLDDEKKKEEEQQAREKQAQIETAWSILHHYWQFVRDNPYDFNGWTYLLSHVETMDNMEAARSAFEGFLPLYPYCFAYWKKLSDMEKKHKDITRCLGVLLIGTECVPFSVDLWLPLLSTFITYAKDNNLPSHFVRSLCQRGLDSVGGAWQSSPLWDACIEYEMNSGDLVAVMGLYRRLILTPLKLYNKHWDHFLALVRDHHPRNLLSVEEYQSLRRKACEELGIKYTPTSFVPPKTVKKTPQPEDKLTSLIKEKIVASYIKTHEITEKEVDKRWKFEERIKRPYFHMKSLDRKQIKNWNEYLDFEINESDPVRIVMLFERSLIACALYEDFWIRYALYMEKHAQDVLDGKYRDLNNDGDNESKVDDDSETRNAETAKENDLSEKKIESTDKASDRSVNIRKISEEKDDSGKEMENKCASRESENNESSGKELDGNDVFENDERGGSESEANMDVPESGVAMNEIEKSSSENEASSVNKEGDISQVPKGEVDISQIASTEVIREDVLSVTNEGSGDSEMLNSGAKESGTGRNSSDETDSQNAIVCEPVSCDAEGKDTNEHAPESCNVELTNVCTSDTEGELQTSEAGTCTEQQNSEVSDTQSGSQISDPHASSDGPNGEPNVELNHSESGDKKTFVPETLEQLKYMLCTSLSLNETVLKCPPLTPEWIKTGVSWEDVRHVYRRGAWIHCPNKPRLLMQWAEFEEMQGNLDTCRELLRTVTAKHPTLLEARMQMIEMESRAGNNNRVEELYGEASRAITDIRQRSWLAIRFARFLFKILLEPDRALVVLRKALKKDRGNMHLYHHVFDICYQRQPLDIQGILASVLLALASKELSAQTKHWFAYKRAEFLKEHGDIKELKQANQELTELKKEMDLEAKEQKREAEKREAELAKEAAEAKKNEENKDTAGEVKGTEANVTTGDGSAPSVTITTDATATTTTTTTTLPDSNLSQQFPVPYFAADGAITYNPMAGYGYGHVDPNQPLPTAQEVVAGTAGGGVPGVDYQTPHTQPGFGKPSEVEWPCGPERYQEYNQLLEGGYPAHLRDKEIQEIKVPFKINIDHLRCRLGNQELGPHLPDLSQPPPSVLDGAGTVTPTTSSLLPLPTTLPPLGFDRPPPYSSTGPPGLPPMPRLFPPDHHNSPYPPGERPPHPLDNRSAFDDRLRYGKRRMMDNFDRGRNEPPYKFRRPDDFDPSLQYRKEYDTNYTSSPGPSAPPSHRAILEHEANLRHQQHQDRWEDRGGARESPELLRFKEIDRYSIRDPANIDAPLSKELELRDHSSLDDSSSVPVNVPEWLMRDGGELKLSHSSAGPSYLRYWPNFMTEKGEKTVFRILRKNLKWHQRRGVDEDGQWQNLPHLLSWVGPCAYSRGGVTLDKNTDWLPEIVDLLHRLIQYTDNKYNCCFLTLFRNGYDYVPWTQENHPALRRDPSIAAVSLGSMRMFEMQRKNGPGFLRFPLYPGSLLLMEGATQEDWEHQFPKEPNILGERIHMTFRKMYMIQGLTV